MRVEDKIKHFVTLTNQYNKNGSPVYKHDLERVMEDYEIQPRDKPNKYGAQTFQCGRTIFRTFKGKLVTKAQSSLTFFKIIDEVVDRPDVLDWTSLQP